MKTLVINGSPRGERSNTMILTRAFLSGTNQPFEVVDVSRSSIKNCLGCFGCWSKTPGKCVIDDDMTDIIQKLITADLIVWSFPLYYFNMPGGLKTLFDRQLPMVLPDMSKEYESGGHPYRYDLAHQKHVVISTCGFWTAEGNYLAINAMFDRYFGKDGYTSFYFGQGELYKSAQLKPMVDVRLAAMTRAGQEFVAGAVSQETRSLLSAPLFEREQFEAIADSSWDKSKS